MKIVNNSKKKFGNQQKNARGFRLKKTRKAFGVIYHLNNLWKRIFPGEVTNFGHFQKFDKKNFSYIHLT